jgi:hypothetical protein
MKSNFIAICSFKLDALPERLISLPLTFINGCPINVIILSIALLFILMVHPLEFFPIRPSIHPKTLLHTLGELPKIRPGSRNEQSLALEQLID